MNEPGKQPATSSEQAKFLSWAQACYWLCMFFLLVPAGMTLAANTDQTDEEATTELPAVVPPSVFVDEPSDPSENADSPMPTNSAAARTPQQSSRMTIRRDPSPDRLATYQELNGERPLRAAAAVPHEFPWMNPAPYGKYVFIHHDPLLFEDIPAERYGEAYGSCIQPVVSFTKFVGTVPMLPYKIPMNYYAARDEDAFYGYDHHQNLRPGVTEGTYFPDIRPGAPYPKSRMKALATYILFAEGVATGVVFLLP